MDERFLRPKSAARSGPPSSSREVASSNVDFSFGEILELHQEEMADILGIRVGHRSAMDDPSYEQQD